MTINPSIYKNPHPPRPLRMTVKIIVEIAEGRYWNFIFNYVFIWLDSKVLGKNNHVAFFECAYYFCVKLIDINLVVIISAKIHTIKVLGEKLEPSKGVGVIRESKIVWVFWMAFLKDNRFIIHFDTLIESLGHI